MNAARGVLLALFCGLAIADAAAQTGPPTEVLGYRITLDVLGPHPRSVTGELLAADADSLWLLTGERIDAIPLRDVEQLSFRRYRFGPGEAMGWSLLGGIVTGVLLTAACESVDDTSGCAAVGLYSLGGWLAIGLLSATSLSGSNVSIQRPTADVRRYARYPQGFPGRPVVGVGLRLRLPRPR